MIKSTYTDPNEVCSMADSAIAMGVEELMVGRALFSWHTLYRLTIYMSSIS